MRISTMPSSTAYIAIRSGRADMRVTVGDCLRRGGGVA